MAQFKIPDLEQTFMQAHDNLTALLIDDVGEQIKGMPLLSQDYEPLLEEEMRRIWKDEYDFVPAKIMKNAL